MGGWGGGGKDRCVQGVFTNGLAMKDIERRQRAEIYLCERESLRGHALWRRSGREARAEKGYQERARRKMRVVQTPTLAPAQARRKTLSAL